MLGDYYCECQRGYYYYSDTGRCESRLMKLVYAENEVVQPQDALLFFSPQCCARLTKELSH